MFKPYTAKYEFTVFNFCVWVTIFLNCDVISLSVTGPRSPKYGWCEIGVDRFSVIPELDDSLGSMLPPTIDLKTKTHDDVIKWKPSPRYWPFVWGIHRSPVNSPHKGQWRGALMFPLTSSRINGWINNREAGDLRRHRTHCDVTVMKKKRLAQ